MMRCALAAWCDVNGMEGCSKFLMRQSNEERDHMLRIFHFINEVEGHALTPAVKQPPLTFNSVNELLRMVYEHEKKVTQAIHKIVDLCYKEDDYTTLHFLQWYIDEQREEEAMMRTILDRVKLIGEGPQQLFFIDQEVEKYNKIAEAEEQQANE